MKETAYDPVCNWMRRKRLCQEKVNLAVADLKGKAFTRVNALIETETDIISHGATYNRDDPNSR